MKLSHRLLKPILVLVLFIGILFAILIISLINNSERPQKRVAIIGAGLAGLSAAIAAVQEDPTSEVHLFEKYPQMGGNSIRASSGMNGVFTDPQKREGIKDSYELFYSDSVSSSKSDFEPELVKLLVEESTSAVEFLSSFGIDLDTLSQCGGHSTKRTHRNHPEKLKYGIGGHIIFTLIEVLEKYKQITVHLSHEVVDIKRNENKLFELVIKNDYVDSNRLYDSVILATGGFSYDRDGFIKKERPDLITFPTTNGPWSKGDGLRFGEKLGGAILGLSHVQVHPTGIEFHPGEWLGPLPFIKGFNKTRNVFLASEAIRGYGALLMKPPGQRFVNELGQRDDLTAEIQEHGIDRFGNGRKVVWMLVNQETATNYGNKRMGKYKAMGLVKTYPEGFREFCDSEPEFDCLELEQTLQKYNSGEESFGKDRVPATYSMDDKPIFRFFITPAIHYTMGGLRIDQNANVLDGEGEVIDGLFAAGEVTGGVHGKNRLAGNSLLECVVFGRRAGENSVQ